MEQDDLQLIQQAVDEYRRRVETFRFRGRQMAQMNADGREIPREDLEAFQRLSIQLQQWPDFLRRAIAPYVTVDLERALVWQREESDRVEAWFKRSEKGS